MSKVASEHRGRAPGIGALAQIACLLEVGAEKPGNVSPTHSFEDCDWLDFAIAAAQVAPVLDRAPGRALGATIRECVERSVAATGQNVNLGIVLLLAPLAAASAAPPPLAKGELRAGIRRVLRSLGPGDAAEVWTAIRTARPAGLGRVAEADLGGPPPADLLEAMRCAADRDLVAKQYATDFEDVFAFGLDALERALVEERDIQRATVKLHLEWLAAFPDSLIARKRGEELAREASRRAREVLDAGGPGSPRAVERLAALDRWLREDGHARNPGTTADLVAATLFLALRVGMIATPLSRVRDAG